MTFENFVAKLNDWGSRKIPFFFVIDFEQKKPLAFRVDEIPSDVKFEFLNTHTSINPSGEQRIEIIPRPVSEESFRKKFRIVKHHLDVGDSYLINLTVRTQIESSASLADIFKHAKARYKVMFQDQFVVFSPETFIRVKDGIVYSFPMKGTIDAAIEKAAEKILSDQKELAEHVTIVDLIRNDLSNVASEVSVERFRYIDTITSNRKTLLQVSSEIRGNLFPELRTAFGTLLEKLLPAGSISGAPKKRTVEIIQQAEGEQRGYYTGIAGLFDGHVFDSGVMIRFIENQNGKLYYRSGGGITASSEWKNEYHEVIDKIYVPLN